MTKLIALVSLLLAPAAALAGAYALPNINPRDLSMAGSAIAAQDSAAATYANPAALSRLPGLNVSVADTLIDIRSTWTDTSGGAFGGPSPVTMIPKGVFPPAVYASYGGRAMDRGWGIGAGLTIPGGGNVFWPDTWPGRFDVLTVDRRVVGTYLTGGIELVPQLRLGGGVIYYRTTEHLLQSVNYISNEGFAEVGTSGGAWSYDLSAEVTPIVGVPLAIGLDYKHQAVQTLEGKAHFDSPPPPIAPFALDQDVTHVLTFPNILEVGAAYAVLPNLLVTSAYTFQRFKVYDKDVFIGSAGNVVTVIHNDNNAHLFRLGTEWSPLARVRLRAGVLRELAPSRADTYSPTLPDANVWAGAIGASYEFMPGIAAHATYYYAHFDEITAVGPNVFPGSYATRTNIFSLGFTWSMEKRPVGVTAPGSRM